MPTQTFLNLSVEKRQQFERVALREFAHHTYDNASINRIIKEVGIARGSVYQYFANKLDLWLYLKEYAETVKMSYIQSVKRDNFADFWDYYKALYEAGVEFDLHATHCSQFLYRIGFTEQSEETRPYLNDWKTKANHLFTIWVDHEKELGTFSKNLSTESIVHVLITLSMSVATLMQQKFGIQFEVPNSEDKPVFAYHKEALLKSIDEMITILKKGLS